MFKYKKVLLFVNRAVYLMSAAMLMAGLALTVVPQPAYAVPPVPAFDWCSNIKGDQALNTTGLISNSGDAAGGTCSCTKTGYLLNSEVGCYDPNWIVDGKVQWCHVVPSGNDIQIDIPLIAFSGHVDAGGNVLHAGDFPGTCAPEPQLCEDTTANNQGEPLPCTYDPPAVCEDTTANNQGEPLPCTYDPPAVCEDTTANNQGEPLPCTYDPPAVCEDTTANNQGEPLPCTYDPPAVCEDTTANNQGEPLPCTYDPPAVCEDTTANNQGEPLPCTYDPPAVCEDTTANNQGEPLPCTYDPPAVCEDTTANNQGEPLPCTYDPPAVCEDTTANNQGEPLPCTYDPPAVCEDTTANNQGEPLPCTYDPPAVCEDTTANNQGEPLPCTYNPPPIKVLDPLSDYDPYCTADGRMQWTVENPNAVSFNVSYWTLDGGPHQGGFSAAPGSTKFTTTPLGTHTITFYYGESQSVSFTHTLDVCPLLIPATGGGEIIPVTGADLTPFGNIWVFAGFGMFGFGMVLSGLRKRLGL